MAVTALLLFAVGTGVVFGFGLAVTEDLPQIEALESFEPHAATRIMSADGEIIAELFVEKRTPVPLEDIPLLIRKGILSTEDRNFYHHHGVDLKGIARAIVHDILAMRFVEGASTITQQLSKTLFLSPEKTINRKLKEAILAFQLERRYTKDEILELYLNQIYYGSGAYGVAEAARIFFDKELPELTTAECALIAGMPKLPSRLSPLVNPGASVRRRNLVLYQMKETGAITKEEYEKAAKEKLHPAPREKRNNALSFIRYLKQEIRDAVSEDQMYKGGLVIETTLSSALQAHARECLNAHIEKIRVSDSRDMEDIEGAIVCVDVETCGILAMVGGRDEANAGYNRAVDARRQPGSAFKPVLYAYAVENGWSQADIIKDAPVAYTGKNPSGKWRPGNYSGRYHGDVTLRHALTHSLNVPAVRLMEKMKPENVAMFAKKMGIHSPLSGSLPLALGASGASLLEMTTAYSVFPRKGVYIAPHSVVRILNREKKVIYENKPERHIAMSREGAAIMTNMLEGVILEGTGKKARVLPGQVAGKTGTTSKYRDALFIGFSPGLAAGVWVGRDSYASLGKGMSGGKLALPIWIDIMKTALTPQAPAYFDIPDAVVKIPFDPKTGARLSETAPKAVSAIFRKGSEPHLLF